MTVNGSLCSASAYENKPCVRVTVCVPGTTTCQTIDDVLLDTGSYGLRLFAQVLTIALPRTSAGGGTLAECVRYGDGSSSWGPIATADVVLGGEPAVTTPIQLIDGGFGAVPSSCASVMASPADAGTNGILGVGPFLQDCGSGCTSSARNGIYFACSGSGCTGVAVSTSMQVQNPVALLPVDNNGLVVSLPAAAASGGPSVNGSVLLGIGTRSNNVPSGPTAIALDRYAEFTTTVSGVAASAFLDTGSNGLFFQAPTDGSLPACAAPNDAWFCPATTLTLQASDADASGTVRASPSFQVANALQLFGTGNAVFPDLGGPAPASSGFDWGLPFFLGRSVYVGFAGRSSALGSGAFVAF